MTEGAARRSRASRIMVALAVMAGVICLCGLGIWQVQRLQWKTDLIARVEARLAATPVPAPGPDEWAGIDAPTDEYRTVQATGRYDYASEVLVQAVTTQGAGFWVMTPLATPDGWSVWVNRGFVPSERRQTADRHQPKGAQQVHGLLRITQPGGAFLRNNDPADGRWYSRDVAALSAVHPVDNPAPYFIDADAGQAGQLPIGGLTVVSFRNSHLGYALTWFGMAIGLAVGGWFVLGGGRARA